MAISKPGDTFVVSPVSVQADAGYAVRAASVHGGYAALAGIGPPDMARWPRSMRRVGSLASTQVDHKYWELRGGIEDINWVEVPFGVAGPPGETGPAGPPGPAAGQVTAGGVDVTAGGVLVVIDSTGTMGPPGPMGPAGPPGPAGPAGLDAGQVTVGGVTVTAGGVLVTVGTMGATGPMGPPGATGPAGDTGPVGPA